MATITASKAQVEATTAWLDLADELDGYDATATYRLQYAGNSGMLWFPFRTLEPEATQSLPHYPAVWRYAGRCTGARLV